METTSAALTDQRSWKMHILKMINWHNSTSESSLHRGGGLLWCSQLLLLHNCPGQTPTIPWQYLTVSCHAIQCHTIQHNTLQCRAYISYCWVRHPQYRCNALQSHPSHYFLQYYVVPNQTVLILHDILTRTHLCYTCRAGQREAARVGK